MTASRVRALSGRAGALLGVIVILVTGYTAAGAGSVLRSGRAGAAQGPRRGRAGAAQDAVAALSSGHTLAHRTAGTTGPRGVTHRDGPGIAKASSLSPCALAAGHPVLYPAGPAPLAGGGTDVPVLPRVCLCLGLLWLSRRVGAGVAAAVTPGLAVLLALAPTRLGQLADPAGLLAWLHITGLPSLAAGADT
jgi:hypothetical protein